MKSTVPVLLSLLVSVGAAAATLASELPQGERVTVAINTDIRGTDPGVNRDSNTDAVMHHIVESLVGYGENLTIKPVVAASYDIEDQGRSYVFRLRSGLRFHNGAPVTAAEVKWSWQRYLDPATRWQCRRWFVRGEEAADDEGDASHIIAIEIPDPMMVVFRLDAPSTLFLDRMANVQCISAVLHPDSVDSDGRWVAPIGTGPYRLKRWRPGEYVELERFASYRSRTAEIDGLAGAKPALARHVRFLISPDAAASKAALLGRQVDLLPNVPMTSLEDFADAPGVQVLESATLGWSVLLLQTRDPLLSDVRIRRAIALAIDRQMVTDFNTYGYASVNSSAVPVGLAAHTPVHDQWYAPDVATARKLLEEAGYRNQPVRIQANRKYQNMYANAVVIQAMLHAAGMNAHIEVLDWASHLANYFAGDFQLSTFSFSALASPAMRYYKLIGDKDVRSAYMWESPRAIALLDEVIETFDPLRQRALFENLHRLMIEDVPIIGLYNAHNAAAVLDDVHGYRPWPLVLPRLFGVWKDDWRD